MCTQREISCLLLSAMLSLSLLSIPCRSFVLSKMPYKHSYRLSRGIYASSLPAGAVLNQDVGVTRDTQIGRAHV